MDEQTKKNIEKKLKESQELISQARDVRAKALYLQNEVMIEYLKEIIETKADKKYGFELPGK